jgi:nitrogen regulatory protein PII
MPSFKAKLVTIIAAYECEDTVREMLEQRGIGGFSVARTEGRGVHGSQREGFAGNANFVFNVVTTEAMATELLAQVESELIDNNFPAIAYSSDVEAVLPPSRHSS